MATSSDPEFLESVGSLNSPNNLSRRRHGPGQKGQTYQRFSAMFHAETVALPAASWTN
jgi:hypothetical protein